MILFNLLGIYKFCVETVLFRGLDSKQMNSNSWKISSENQDKNKDGRIIDDRIQLEIMKKVLEIYIELMVCQSQTVITTICQKIHIF